jgi:hypothetical protein
MLPLKCIWSTNPSDICPALLPSLCHCALLKSEWPWEFCCHSLQSLKTSPTMHSWPQTITNQLTSCTNTGTTETVVKNDRVAIFYWSFCLHQSFSILTTFPPISDPIPPSQTPINMQINTSIHQQWGIAFVCLNQWEKRQVVVVLSWHMRYFIFTPPYLTFDPVPTPPDPKFQQHQ